MVQWGGCSWSEEALAAAFGRQPHSPLLTHPLNVQSAYAAVAGREPPFTTCHSQGQKTVDFILYTTDAFATTSADAAAGAHSHLLSHSSVLAVSLPSYQCMLLGFHIVVCVVVGAAWHLLRLLRL